MAGPACSFCADSGNGFAGVPQIGGQEWAIWPGMVVAFQALTAVSSTIPGDPNVACFGAPAPAGTVNGVCGPGLD